MQREICDDVKTGNSVTLFQSVEKSPAFNKTVSNFDHADLKVKKIEGSLNMRFTMQILLDTFLER